ncbi:MAG: hypothetical protein WAW61_17660 [Methylococcaceae bacterium]
MLRLLLQLLMVACCLLPHVGHAVISRQLDEEIDRKVVKSSTVDAAAEDKIRALKEAIAKGDAASKQLKEEIQSLEKIQTALTSGLTWSGGHCYSRAAERLYELQEITRGQRF